MDSRSDDYQLLPKFFAYQQVDQEWAVDFPLPHSAADLKYFFKTRNGRKYKQGCREIIRTIRDWSRQQLLNTDNLDRFEDQYLNYSGDDPEQNTTRIVLYTEGMVALGNIAALLSNPNICDKKNIIENLIKDILSCGPGTHTHIINTCLELKAKINLPIHLMKIRRKIAEQAIVDALFDADQGMEIHYVNAVLNNLSILLNIEQIEDDYIEYCDSDITEQALMKVIAKKDKLFSLDNILNALLTDTGYETVADNANKSGYDACLGFIQRLSFYGEEDDVVFLYADDFIASNEDYTEFELCWSAPYVLRLSLLRRLQNENYVALNYIEQTQANHRFYFMMNASLKLAFVFLDNPEDKKDHQPLLTYLVKQVVSDNIKLLDYLLNYQLITKQHRLEILIAFADYYASLKTDEQLANFEKIILILISRFSIDEFIKLPNRNLQQKVLNALPLTSLAKHVKGDVQHLADVMECMAPANISKFIHFLYMRAGYLNTSSIISNLARLGYLNILKDIFRTYPHRITMDIKHLALIRACATGHLKIVEFILSDPKVNIDYKNLHSATGLIVAIANGHENVANFLINAGASPYIVSRNNQSPLFLAVKRDIPSVVNNLLAHHATHYPPDLLPYAITNSSYAICVTLLRYNFPVNYEEVSLYFLHDIIENDDIEAASLLLPRLHPSDVNMVNNEDGPPLYHAIRLGRYDIVKLLLDYNADAYTALNGVSCIQLALNLHKTNYFRILAVQKIFTDLHVPSDTLCARAFKQFRNNAFHHEGHFGTLCDLFMRLALVTLANDNAHLTKSIDDMYLYYLNNGHFEFYQLNGLLLQCRMTLTSLENPTLSSQIYQFFRPRNLEFEYRLKELIPVIREHMNNLLHENGASVKRAKY